MRVLITGGAGFVGLNLAEALLRLEHDVVFFDLREPPAQFMESIGPARHRVRIETGDVGSGDDIQRVFLSGDITHVFHGAAITPGPARESSGAQQIIDVNVSGTVTIARAAAQAHVHRLVFPSSLTVYGEHLYGEAPVDEVTTPPVPESLYGITKYAAERVALRLGALWGLNVVAGRIGAAFGPWEGETGVRDLLSPYAQVAAAAAAGKPVILPEVYAPREMIYSRDLAQALLLLLFAERPSYDVYNLSVNADWTNLLPQWCERVREGMSGFNWRYAASDEQPTVGFPDNRKRTGMRTSRLRDDLDFVPQFPTTLALTDYASWLAANHTYFK